MQLYKFSGTKIVAFDSNISSSNVDSSVPATLAELNNSSFTFEFVDIRVYVDLKSFPEAPLSFSDSSDTDLQKWDRDRELVKNFYSIGLDFKVDNTIIFRTNIMPSQVPYDFSISKNIALNTNQNLKIDLINNGYGLLFGTDIINISLTYQLTYMGV